MRAGPSQPRVSAVVLHYNGLDDTLACLESLREQTGVSLRIVLVNNGPASEATATLAARFPEAQLVNTGRNLGYAGGNNVGLRHALADGADYVLALNNDTVLAPGCVRALADDLAGSGAGAAAPKSFYHAQPEVIYFAGGTIDARGYPQHTGSGQPDGPGFSTPADCDWLTGCAILFEANTLRAVGDFEERYYLLFEDSDWSLRARRRGLRLRFVPAAQLWHKVSPSFGQTWSPLYTYYFTRNNLWWIERNFPLRQRLALFRQAMDRIRWLTGEAARGQGPDQTAATQPALQAGVRDYVLRRFGQRNW